MARNLKNQGYEKSKNEVYAEQWFVDNGFHFTLDAQYISKAKYTVSKSGVEDSFELSDQVSNIKTYMQSYGVSFEMKVELVKLRQVKQDINKGKGGGK